MPLVPGTRIPSSFADCFFRPWLHFFAANYADVFASYLFRRSIGVPGVHVRGSASIPDEVPYPRDEGAKSEVDVSNYVQRQTVPRQDYCKEGKICQELEEIC